MTDPYALSAEFYDVMAMSQWRNLGPAVARALSSADASHGPLLEVGAGTGLSTKVIADAVPGAHIIAVEPSAGMRIALTSRLMNQPGLAERVTVEPVPVDRVELPPTLCAAAVVGVVGYLEPSVRAWLWSALAERLGPGAPVVVDVMALPMPMKVPTMRVANARIGELDYEVFLAGEPADKTSQRWSMTYKVLRRGQELRTFHTEHVWQVFGIDHVIREAESAGFRGTKLTPHMAVLSRAAAA